MSRAFDSIIAVLFAVCLASLALAWAYPPTFPPISAPLNWNTSR